MSQLQIAFAGVPAAPGTDGLWAPSSPSADEEDSLLPTPLSECEGDALAGLLALASESRRLGMTRAIENVNYLRSEQRAEWENQKAAIFAAAEAREDGGFWESVGKVCGAVGKVAGVVAAVAVVVGTGGAGAPLVLAAAGAVLSGAALAEGEFQILDKLGVDAKAAPWIQAGLALAGAACTMGAAYVGGAQTVTQLQKAVHVTGKVTTIGGGAADVAQGVAIIGKAKADEKVENCNADFLRANLEATRAEQMLIRILDDLEEGEKSFRRTVGVVKDSMQIQENTLLLASGRN
jgi:hypothetical protein